MLVDLSHTIEQGMVTYKGLPAPLICDFLSRDASKLIYADGVEFQIGKLEMVGNTGTYLDSPFHRFAKGKDLSELPLESLANLPSVKVIIPKGTKRICAAFFHNLDLQGKAVLIQTEWSNHWRTDQYFENHPFLTREAAEFLLQCGPKLVGIDSYNIDNTADWARPAHSLLLGRDIPIVEHLTKLEELPEKDFLFYAVPPKVKCFGTFPVRAFAQY